jgi:hypothetical protein
MATAGRRNRKQRSEGFDESTVEQWKYLSQVVHQARCTAQPSGANELLRTHLQKDRSGPLAPTLSLWSGDNLLAEGRFDKAIAAYSALLDRYPEARFAGTPWGVHALEQTAVCHENSGEHEKAADVYGRMLKSYRKFVSASRIYFRQADLAEQAGGDKQAIALYRRASQARNWPRHGQVNLRDLARRNADRLESGQEWVRHDYQTLADEVSRTLWKRDARALEALASRTHFSYAPGGGERHFTDRKALLDRLRADLSRSEIAVHPRRLRGSGGKLYLDSTGWKGETFADDVTFLLSQTHRGYEWSGVVATHRRGNGGDFPRDPKEVPDPPDPGPEPEPPPGPVTFEATPADLRLKAPFPRGEHFRAGGIIPMAVQLAGIALALGWTGPFFPLAYAQALVTLAASSPCGLGFGGLYYGQSPTHVDRDRFAVDFATYLRGVPFALSTRGHAVLAIADGIVTYVESSRASGDPTIANQVNVDHLLDVEKVLDFFSVLFGNGWLPTKYFAEYLHLDGPGRVPVSVGMYVRQGTRLGAMDDTGLSVLDHLHFSLHDRALPWDSSSVRPTPMDGQTLNNDDDGRCMYSTNVPIP